jgi:hypothetical protein
MKPASQNPVSFPVHVGRLPKNGFPVHIEADEAARAALAEENGLLEVKKFVADLMVREWKGDGVKVSGRLEADIVQACIVTLDPVPAAIREDVEEFFVPDRSRLSRPDAGGEILLDSDGPDSPEPFSGDTIDVGALAAQLFTLAIDPYPRKADAVLDPPAGEAAEEPSGENTLRSQLMRLRSKQ